MDTISMDVPLFIRCLEYAREDAKSDLDLHNLATNALKAGDKVLTMSDYALLVSNLDSVLEAACRRLK